jgi:predicted DNA-binding transcriptional regulator YafY
MCDFGRDDGSVQRIERLHAITEELRRRAPATVPARELAERFGVTRRTIERDLETLRLAGVPLYGDRGRRGGSGLIAAGPTRPISLTPAEATALVVAAHLSPDAPFATAGRSAIEKVLAALDEGSRVATETLRDRFRLASPAAAPRRRVRSTIEDAVREQRVVRIGYTDGHGAETRRDVDPVGLYLDVDHWALVGWCHLRADARMFLLDRITDARLTRRAASPHDLDEMIGWVPRPGRRV